MSNMDYNIDELRKRVSLFLIDEVDDEVIEEYIKHALNFASLRCSYKTLPMKIQYICVDTVVEAINRRGHEGFSSRSELSVSTSYIFKDIEDSLSTKLKGLKNPKSLYGGY